MNSAESTRSKSSRSYYFDSYALVERQLGARAYEPYREYGIFTHQFNLFEFAAAVVRSASEATAREQLRLMNPNLVAADENDLFAAIRFRGRFPRSRISYVDALGYVLALRHGHLFLTGDTKFEGLDNVEYVR